MTKVFLKKKLILLGFGLFFFVSHADLAADFWQLNMYKGVTPVSKDIYHLHMIAMLVCAVIGVIVFSVMIYSLIYHRKSRGVIAAGFRHNTRLEIIWSIIPFLILVGLAIPATTILIRMNNTADSDITIKVVGSQWKWQYQYLNQGISFYSILKTPYSQIQNQEKKNPWYLLEVDKPLVLPIHHKVRFLVTSTDVIHSWWVPELGIKRDAIPGFMYEAWAVIEKPGVYRGQCTELCGINHAFMPIVVKAVSDEDFAKWVAQQPVHEDTYSQKPNITSETPKMTSEALMQLGQKKYEQYCVACHKANGEGHPPLYSALKGSSVAVGKPISRHILLILNGVPGSAMQGYRSQLTDDEVAAIVTYERNAWGNNTGDVVQPTDVASAWLMQNKPVKKIKKAKAGSLE